MSRHHKNPIGDHSGLYRESQPVVVVIGCMVALVAAGRSVRPIEADGGAPKEVPGYNSHTPTRYIMRAMGAAVAAGRAVREFRAR